MASPLTNAATDEELMARFQAGDADSFADLAGRYSVPLLKLATRYLGIREDAEEVRQETLLRVYSRGDSFRDGASFRPWIYRIALNLCRDRNRRRRRLQWFSLSDETGETRSYPDGTRPAADDRLEEKQRSERLRGVLRRLPEVQRTVLILKEFEEMKFREIAEILGCPESTVKSRLYGGLSALKTMLEEPATGGVPGAGLEER